MPRKRVPINISLPDMDFRFMVYEIAEQRGVSPSEEFVALYKRLAKRCDSTPAK
jgi:hypothetical protein